MLDAVRNRRSVRRYEDRPIEPAVVEQLQEAVLRAPSSRNLKPCRFVFVTDAALLEQLAHAKASFGAFIAEAALAVVVCADAALSDCWIEDGSIAAATLQLVATDLGLGSCWVQIRARDNADGGEAQAHVRATLDLPAEQSVLCIVALGYPAQTLDPRDRASLSWEKIETR
jgi:nitroreductase